MQKKIKIVLAVLLIPQILLVKWASNYTEFITHYYSNGVYVYSSKLIRLLLGWIPFSLGDIFYFVLLIYVVYWLVKNIKKVIKNTKQWLISVLAFCSVIYFLFQVLWGLNYYREPLNKTLNLKSNYTTAQLIAVTQQLIEKANSQHVYLVQNDSLMAPVPYTTAQILNIAAQSYKGLGKKYPSFNYTYPSIKKSLFSYPLTYMGFSGYLNPFSLEAQVNAIIPIHSLPTTATHEIAHQLGYAAENEANFIGCLAAINSSDLYFQYAGFTFAMYYCLIEVHQRDAEAFKDLKQHINKGILKQFKASSEFWEQHENPIEPLFKLSYNQYLKANKQEHGLESYNYVVALFCNYFEQNPV